MKKITDSTQNDTKFTKADINNIDFDDKDLSIDFFCNNFSNSKLYNNHLRIIDITNIRIG